MENNHQIRFSADELKLILNTVPAIIFMLDFGGKIVWANKTTLTLLGYKEEALNKMSIGHLLDPEGLRGMMEDREFILANNQSSHPRIYFLKKEDGTKMPVEGNATKMPGEDEDPIFLGVAWDISKRLAAEEKQTTLSQELAHALKVATLGTLLGSTAHEFNNQLMGVLHGVETSLTRIAQNNMPDLTEITRLLSVALAAANRMREMNSNILGLAHKGRSEVEPIDIKSIIQKILDYFTPLIEKDGIEIQMNAEFDYPFILGVADQLTTVFLNLLTNAKDALEEAQDPLIQIFLGMKNLDQGDIPRRFIETTPGVFIEIKVIDNGSGIAQDILEKIFEPFFSTKGIGEGTGLGLPTIMDIIIAHRGVLLCKSSVGEGTTFSILLPAVN